jgi:hypothetical protein
MRSPLPAFRNSPWDEVTQGHSPTSHEHSPYADHMKPAGGLKLALQTRSHEDRRARFATIAIVPAGSDEEVSLVTDSRGRLRYWLLAGEYQIRAAEGGKTQFSVSRGCWTTVRLRLP